MARISTGQTYGDTNRSTAAQLLGGIPTDATSGAIAQGAITAPSLQPRATPVSTFQQVGAPILGGAPKFFAPPDLPNPGQDMANLAKALGGFSTTLQGFSEAYVSKQQADAKEAEQRATGLVTKYGPAYDLAKITSTIEKRVALGGPDAPQAARDLQLLREMQNSSVGRVWLERSSEQNAISESVMSLSGRLENTSTIDVGGQKIELSSLPTTDPRWKEYRDGQLFDGRPISAATAAKNQQFILNAQLQADDAQRKRYNVASEVRFQGQLADNLKYAAGVYVTNFYGRGGMGAAIAAGSQTLQSQIDQTMLTTLTPEAKKKAIDGILESWATNVITAAKATRQFIPNLGALINPVLRNVLTGPVDQRIGKDGAPNEALRLYNTLGGEPYLDRLGSDLQQRSIQNESQLSQLAKIDAERQYNDARTSAQKNGTLGTAFYDAQERAALAIQDPNIRGARLSAINADRTQFDATYTAPAQALKALNFTQQLATTLNDDAGRKRLAAEIEQALVNKQITGSMAISLQGSIAAQSNKDVRAYDGAINKRMAEIRKREKAYHLSESSYGGSVSIGYENDMMTNFETKGFQGAQSAVAKAIAGGKDPTDAINKYFDNSNFGFTRRIDPAPSYQSLPQLLQQNTGSASRNVIDPLKANGLRGSAQNKQVLEQGAFISEMDTWLRTGKPTEGFKTLMKALTGGGQKASDVILNQYRLHGIPVDPAALPAIKALDGQKLSMATPQSRMTPQQNPALMGISIASRALSNLLVPPASAMEMPALPPLPLPAVVTPKAKLAPSFPSRVTEVGYYAGGGGQDGVAGGRTANGDIYNPSKMTVAVQWTLRDKLLNKWLLVQDAKTGKTVRVWANDVGPLVGDSRTTGARHLDLSSAAFAKLFGSTGQGLGRIKYKVDPSQKGRP
jgi:rare lipoprotein A (peptidoglycan hydrolase)